MGFLAYKDSVFGLRIKHDVPPQLLSPEQNIVDPPLCLSVWLPSLDWSLSVTGWIPGWAPMW